MIDTTPCIRCGKSRIVAKSWKENGIKYTQTVCPDKECQKEVEKELQRRNQQFASLQNRAAERRKSTNLSRAQQIRRRAIFQKNNN